MCTSSSHSSPQESAGTHLVSTSATDCPANAGSTSSSIASSVSELKERGNCMLKEGKPKAAVKAYTGALQNAALEQLDDHGKAVLLSNRSLAYVRAHLNAKVASDCRLLAFRHTSVLRCKISTTVMFKECHHRSHFLGSI